MVERHDLQFEGREGIKLAADGFGDPANDPVLLLHGGGQTRHSWRGTAEQLAASGWYAVTLDLRGHGGSGWSPDGAYDSLIFRDDVLAAARAFEKAPVLIGASLGGISSLLAIAEGGNETARALVLVDIATRMEESGAERIMQFMAGGMEGFDSLDDVADAVAAYNPHRPRPKDVSGLEKNLRKSADGRYHWHWDPKFITPTTRADTHFVSAEQLDEAARSLTLPVLLVRGKLSDLLSEEGAKHFLETVPHAKFTDVSGAGHMVAGDRNDAFGRAVLDFLEADLA